MYPLIKLTWKLQNIKVTNKRSARLREAKLDIGREVNFDSTRHVGTQKITSGIFAFFVLHFVSKTDAAIHH